MGSLCRVRCDDDGWMVQENREEPGDISLHMVPPLSTGYYLPRCPWLVSTVWQ